MNKLDKQYLDLIQTVLTNGYKSSDRTGTGTIKTFGNMMSHNMKDGFPLLTIKKMFTKGIIYELLWFLRGETNIKYMVDNGVNIWVGDCYKKYKQYASLLDEPDYFVHVDDPQENCTRLMTEKEFIEAIKIDDKFAKQFGELNKVYGAEWVNWDDKINQVAELIETLKTNPDSRRMMVTAWNPTNVKNALLPPCHYAWQVFTRELTITERQEMSNKYVTAENQCQFATEKNLDKAGVPKREISLMFNMRSVDVGLGLPFDISSYGFLLLMIAQTVNMVPGELKCCLGDTHIYNNHIEPIQELFNRTPMKLPTCELNADVTDIFSFKYEDINIVDYESNDKLVLPLSN